MEIAIVVAIIGFGYGPFILRKWLGKANIPIYIHVIAALCVPLGIFGSIMVTEDMGFTIWTILTPFLVPGFVYALFNVRYKAIVRNVNEDNNDFEDVSKNEFRRIKLPPRNVK